MKQETFALTNQSKSSRTFERIGLMVSLIALVATFIGLLIQLRTEKRAVEVQVVSADQLTRLPLVSGLTGEFSYNNIPVVDLWRLKLQFTNIGDATLIGEGASSSLMTKKITFTFPAGVSILDASSETDSFYTLSRLTANSFAIEFTQWRPDETFETLVYLGSNDILDNAPLPLLSGRPLINGDILITDLTSTNATQPRQVIDYVPAPLALAGKILGGVFALAIGLFSFGFLVIAGPYSYLRGQFWRYKYSDAFKQHITNLELSERRKNELLKMPWNLSDHFPSSTFERVKSKKTRTQSKSRATAHEGARLLTSDFVIRQGIDPWEAFDGPPAQQPTFETFQGTLVGMLVGVGLTFACAAIIASILVV